MNPYLENEDAWHNFHEQFPAAVVAALEPQLGPKYFAKVDEHIYIHEMPEDRRRLGGLADVAVRDSGQRVASSAPAPGTATVLHAGSRPVLLPAVETVGLSYVEIRDRRTRRVVTIIELLSPSNKQPGPDRDQYLIKRAAILASSTHFVEIDLLRGRPRMPLLESAASDYCVLISRAPERPRAECWDIRLREALPTIPIPLAPGDPEPGLGLQQILHHLYDAGGYAKFIYDLPPDPPLFAEDNAWAQAIVASALGSTSR